MSNPYENKQQNHDPRPPVMKQPKSQLFYSKFCQHSKSILDKIRKSCQEGEFDYVCIDNRYVKENITYINLLGGRQAMPLPPMINRVPSMLLVPNYEVLVGDQILDYISPKAKTVSEEETNMMNIDPNPFSLNNDLTGGFGVASDSFSFLDTSPEDLGASGNGGSRQMYNYATIDGVGGQISTPMEQNNDGKMRMSMEEIQNRRNMEIN